MVKTVRVVIPDGFEFNSTFDDRKCEKCPFHIDDDSGIYFGNYCFLTWDAETTKNNGPCPFCNGEDEIVYDISKCSPPAMRE